MAGSSWSLELLRDPMLQAAWATLLAIVFAIAAAHKLRDRDGFLRQLAAYQLLPQPVLLGVVIVLWVIVLAQLLAIWALAQQIGVLCESCCQCFSRLRRLKVNGCVLYWLVTAICPNT